MAATAASILLLLEDTIAGGVTLRIFHVNKLQAAECVICKEPPLVVVQ